MSPEDIFDLEFQLGQLELTVCKIGELAEGKASLSEQEAALAGFGLHGFYNGIESSLRLILRARGVALPTGEKWHSTLLDMALDETSHNPPIFTAESVKALRPVLAFRHAFRHMYHFELDPVRTLDLANHVVVWWPTIQGQIKSVIA